MLVTVRDVLVTVHDVLVTVRDVLVTVHDVLAAVHEVLVAVQVCWSHSKTYWVYRMVASYCQFDCGNSQREESWLLQHNDNVHA